MLPPLMNRSSRTFTPPQAFAFIIALVVHTAVPAGYMPAALAQGWLISVCPGGLNASTLGSSSTGHAHDGVDAAQHTAHQHEPTDHAADTQHDGRAPAASDGPLCAVGAGFDQPYGGFVGEGLRVHAAPAASANAPERWLVIVRPARAYRPRAPPVSSSATS